MKTRGFTLIEMIAVVGIIALISLISFPAIINQLGEKREEISETTKMIIFDAADLYFSDHQSEYPKAIGESYCITLDSLVSNGMLKSPINDYSSGDEIPLTWGVKTTINSFFEYSDYNLVEKCE